METLWSPLGGLGAQVAFRTPAEPAVQAVAALVALDLAAAVLAAVLAVAAQGQAHTQGVEAEEPDPAAVDLAQAETCLRGIRQMGVGGPLGVKLFRPPTDCKKKVGES